MTMYKFYGLTQDGMKLIYETDDEVKIDEDLKQTHSKKIMAWKVTVNDRE